MAKKKKPIPVDKKIEKLIEIYKEAEKRLMKTIAEKEIKGNVTTFYIYFSSSIFIFCYLEYRG